MRIVFEVAGDKQIEREILRTGDRVTDATPAWHRVVDLFRDETREQFASEGAHASGGWAPLSASTLRRRGGGRRTRSGGVALTLGSEGGGIFAGLFAGASTESRGAIKILDDTGALRRSLTQRGDPNQIVEILPLELSFGSNLPYSRYHQTGTSRMPRRRPLEFTERARVDTVKILQRYILTGEVAQ